MLVLFIGSALSALSDVQRRLGVVALGPASTAPRYRLFTVEDRLAALLEDPGAGTSVSGELGEISEESWKALLATDPPEMYTGTVELTDGRTARSGGRPGSSSARRRSPVSGAC